MQALLASERVYHDSTRGGGGGGGGGGGWYVNRLMGLK